jgi:hypothetical protein
MPIKESRRHIKQIIKYDAGFILIKFSGKYSVNQLRYCPTFTPLLRAAIRLPEVSPDAVTGAAQVVHFWAIPQQSAGSVNNYVLRAKCLQGELSSW